VTLRTRYFAAIILVFCAGVLLFAQSPSTQRLLQLLDTPDSLDKDDEENELIHAAIEAGPAAVPVLGKLLQRLNGEEQKSVVRGALMMIGGTQAVSILQTEYEKGEEDAGIFLAIAMASVDSKRNRETLTRLLTKDPARDHDIIAAAAFSLGLLRATEALPSLRALAQGPADRNTTDAAKLAIQSIEKGFWKIKSQPLDARQRILAAILKVGIPDEDYEYFFDETGGGFWRYNPAGWTFTKGEPQDRSSSGPEVDDIFVSSDGRRAFVSIRVFCGPRCAVGYGYSLRQDGRDWKVQMWTMLWIT